MGFLPLILHLSTLALHLTSLSAATGRALAFTTSLAGRLILLKHTSPPCTQYVLYKIKAEKLNLSIYP